MSEENIKTVQAFALPVIILIIAMVVISKVSGGIASLTGNSEEDKENERLRTEEDKTVIAGIKPNVKMLSFTPNQYLDFSTKLYDAMKGSGTDEDAISAVLSKIFYQDDWDELIRKYGVKQGKNLLSWLRDEFPVSSTVFMSQNDINEKLSRRGIKKNLV